MALFLLTCWLIRTVASVASLTYYWQLKEYRWDRMSEFLVRQGGFSKVFTSFHIGYLLFLPLPLVLDDPNLYPTFVAILLLAESLKFFHRVFLRKVKRPRLTGKVLLIMGVSMMVLLLVLGGMFLEHPLLEKPASLAVVLSLLIVFEMDLHAVFVWMANVASNFMKRRVFEKARKKRERMKDLQVVGITGSFGKTSVKEFLARILEEDFRTLKTAKNTNTEMGIAQTILDHLKNDHEVFVCEMGAYAEGEISICCDMAQPKVALFTGLNEQHVSLFGGIDHTFAAKWELLDSLPSDGVGIFNGESEELKKRLKSFKGKTIVCSLADGEAVAQEVSIKPEGIAFVYDDQHYEAPLVGGFHVINVLMAVVAAEQLGMNPQRIAERVKTLRSPDQTLEMIPFDRGTILDDSYNVNSDGLKAALDHLQQFTNHRKILFFPGIQELGKETERIHAELAEVIADKVDWVFYHDPSSQDFLARESRKHGLGQSHIIMDSEPQEMTSQLQRIFADHADEKFVILFESRGAEKVLEALK